jgi:putative hemolysin
MDLLFELAVLAALIFFSGFFSGVEIALVSVNPLRVKYLVKHKKKGARSLQKLKANPERMLITVLIGNNIVNILASSYATYIAIQYFGFAGVGVSVASMTFLILIFGEIMPKTLAASHSEWVALHVAKAIRILQKLIYPLIIVFEHMSKYTGYWRKSAKRPLITEDEIKTMVEVGVEENVLDKDNRDLIEGVLEFDDIAVKEVMTPRVKMFILNASTGLDEAIQKINRTKYSRIPIFEGENREKIVGIVHIKDIMRATEKNMENLTLKDIAKKPFFTSKETIIDDLFGEMKRRHQHMAIVMNEFGGVEGLVTIENLLEEIFGEIRDENDSFPQHIMKINDNTLIAHGDTSIDLLDEELGVELPRESDYVTVNGLMHYMLKKIPEKGEAFRLDNITFHVDEVIDNNPSKIRITVDKHPN